MEQATANFNRTCMAKSRISAQTDDNSFRGSGLWHFMDHLRDQIIDNEDKTLRPNVVSSGRGRYVVCAVSFSDCEKLLI
jgi:hypothetical protein